MVKNCIKKEKIKPGIQLIETERGYRIESYPRKGSIRERRSTTVKKTGDLEVDLEKLEMAKASVISHYNAMDLKASIGTIIPDEEYTIRGMSLVGGRQGIDKTKIPIHLAIRRKGGKPYFRKITTYTKLIEVWEEATDHLVAFHGLESKPEEWINPPSELYYNRLQKRLIDHKNKIKQPTTD